MIYEFFVILICFHKYFGTHFIVIHLYLKVNCDGLWGQLAPHGELWRFLAPQTNVSDYDEMLPLQK